MFSHVLSDELISSIVRRSHHPNAVKNRSPRSEMQEMQIPERQIRFQSPALIRAMYKAPRFTRTTNEPAANEFGCRRPKDGACLHLNDGQRVTGVRIENQNQEIVWTYLLPKA